MNDRLSSPHVNVQALVDGELTEAEQQQALAHMGTCSVCQAALAEQRHLSSLLQSAALPAYIPDASAFLAELVPQLPPRKPAVSPNRLGLRWLPPVIVLGSQALIQGVGIMVLALWLLGGQGLLLQQLGGESLVRRMASSQVGPVLRTLLLQNTLGSVNGPLSTVVGSTPWPMEVELVLSFVVFALAFAVLGIVFLGTLAVSWPVVRRSRQGVATRHPEQT